MATRKASIGAELTLDKRGFTRTLNSAIGDARRGAQQMGGIRSEGAFGGMRSGVERLGKAYTGIRGVVGDVINLVKSPLAANTDYADLKDMLTAVEGSAESAAESLAFLRTVGNEQAMPLGPLVEAQARLVSLGFSAAEARDMVRELANAAEFSGLDDSAVSSVVGTLEKINEKGDASVKQLMAFGDAMPVLRNIMDLQFGAKTAADLEKLDLTGRQVFDNLLTGLKQVQTAQASTAEKVQNGESWLKNLTGADEAAADLPARVVGTESAEQRAARLAEMQEAAAAKRAAAAEELLSKEKALLDLELELAQAEQGGDQDAIRAAEEKLALARDLEKVMKDTGASEERAGRAIKEQLEYGRQLKEMEKQKFRGETAEDLEVSTLRAQGKDKQADKRQAEITQRRRAQELEAGGLDALTAGQIAEQERQNSEDEERFQRTGRRRIRGGKSKGDATSFTGLADPFRDARIVNDTFNQNMGQPETNRLLKPWTSKQGGPDDDERFKHGKSLNRDSSFAAAIRPLEAKMSEMIAALKGNNPGVGAKTRPRN